MPDEISMTPYTSLQQPDPMKALSNAAGIVSTFQDVQQKQRALQAQTQTAEIIKLATDANGVYHQDQAQQLLQSGKYPWAAKDMTAFNLNAANLQAGTDKAVTDAKSARVSLLAQMALPYTNPGLRPEVAVPGLKAAVSFALEHGYLGSADEAQQWNRRIETATPQERAQIAVQFIQQGFPVTQAGTPTEIKTKAGGSDVTSGVGAVPLLAGVTPGAPPAPGEVPAAGPAAPGAPATPAVAPVYGTRSEYLQGADKAMQAFNDQQADLPQRLGNIREMISTQGHFTPGPVAEELGNLRGAYQELVTSFGLGPAGGDQALAAQNEFRKNATQYALSRGGNTDAERLSIIMGNPSIKMDPTSLAMVSHFTEAIELGRAELRHRAIQARKANPNTFDFNEFRDDFEQAYDPRVAAVKNMSIPEVKLMMGRLGSDPAALQDFMTAAKNMRKMKLIDATVTQKLQAAAGGG